MKTVDEIKADLIKAEKMFDIAKKQNAPESVMKNAENKLNKIKSELEELEKSTKEAIDEAKEKVKEAETKVEKKDAKEELSDAKKDSKEVGKLSDKVKKAEKVAKTHGGANRNQGRKPSAIPKMPKEKGKRGGYRATAGRKKKATSTIKMVKPSGYKPKKNMPVFVKRKVVKKAVKKVELKKVEKVKSVRAFGQKVEYKNDSEFCSKLISAFKKRKATSKKLGKKRTRPVFGVITSHIKDAVTRAIDNTPKKTIEANPKAFLAKAQRLEKSAIRFLEDFKSILGSDFKKSEISSEFGDLEKSIKKLVSKYK